MSKIIRLNTIDSTNNYAKTLIPLREDVEIIALEQTSGRGTKGRNFSSQLGGIYFSRLTFYKNFLAKDSFLIMSSAATAVCKTLETFGFSPEIKWANDVFVNGRKICGMLIENGFCGDKVDYSIVGIGLNVNNLLPNEIRPIATTMFEEGGKRYSLLEVEEELLKNAREIYPLEEYRKRLGFLNKPIVICKNAASIQGNNANDQYFFGKFEGITDSGELIAMVDGKRKIFSAAEISFRERR